MDTKQEPELSKTQVINYALTSRSNMVTFHVPHEQEIGRIELVFPIQADVYKSQIYRTHFFLLYSVSI